ncbi:hypothetical protein GJAV_G00163170 [Gymnothorax javanicus]|nr:hypothetical protein GJAV_G00163170 [Gymnothorax javanicus]
MPRKKQEQPKRLPAHLNRVEEEEADRELAEEDGWFGNASDTPSESSYADMQDDLRVSPDDPRQDRDTSAESSLGCPTPVPRASLELLGLDGEAFQAGGYSAQDTLSSVVSSLYGEASQTLGKPLSSNLRRLLEAGSIRLEAAELVDRGRDSPPVSLSSSMSPSSHHAQQLSALARKLAKNSSASASPASMGTANTVMQEPCDPFAGSNGGGFMWVGGADVWPPASGSTPSNGSSLSPDSAIQKLKAAANAVLQDKSAVASSASSSSSSSSLSSSSSVVAVGSRAEDAVRFDAFASPFSPQSASSTLAALSKKVSERGLSGPQAEQPSPASSFLSLVSMTSSAALLKEVAARAAGNLLAEKKETVLSAGPPEDSKSQLDRNQKPPTPNQTLDLPPPPTSKGKVKSSSQGSPEDGGKPFQCPVCGLVIKRKSYWKRHMVIHTGLKSHQCPMCPFRCARKDNLKSHMKVHQHQDRGETFQCELCPFTSSRHFSLKLHMRCHQHFPRSELKVKEEITTDTEGEGSLLGETLGAGPGAGLGVVSSSPILPDALIRGSPTNTQNHVHVKEEPLEQDVSTLSPFSLCRERPASSGASSLEPAVPKSSPPTPVAASLFSPDISTKTASDLLIKLSAANQKESLKPQMFSVKEEPQSDGPLSPPLAQTQSGFVLGPDRVVRTPEGPLKPEEDCPPPQSSILSQDISVKVASELLMKLSENNKDAHVSTVTVKTEPMEVDPPDQSPQPPTRLLGLSPLPGCEKTEPLPSLADSLALPQKTLFSQDISIKMASELLYQLSEKVSKANNHKDTNMLGMKSQFLEDRFVQSPYSSCSKDPVPNEASSSGSAVSHDSEKAGEDGVWRLNEQLYPCPVCGKVFGRQQTLSRHLSLHTEERKYRCHLCPYAAKCRANLNQHLTVHSVKLVSTDAEQIVTAVTAESSHRSNCPYYYSCHVCGFETELNAQFVSHMSLHVDKEQWMFSLCCSSCDFVCSEENDIKQHIAADHTGLSSRSPLSETKSTSSLSALSDSLNGSESGDASLANEELQGLLVPPSSGGSQSGSGTDDKSEKGLECVFCNFVCKTRTMYERHLQIHLIARMFECDVCHKFMKTPEQLLEHKKCHTVPTGGLKVCEALWGPEQMKGAI